MLFVIPGGFCTKGNEKIRAYEHTNALTTSGENVVCPDGQSQCPDGNTCCKLSSGGYGCCPLPNAVCCSDGVHCCPNGYTCSGGNELFKLFILFWSKYFRDKHDHSKTNILFSI